MVALFRRGRLRRGIVNLAGHRLSLDRRNRRLVLLPQRHILVFGAVENQIERLAFDHLRGQGVEEILALKTGADAARRFAVLLGDALDFLVQIVVIDIDLLDLGDF